MACGTAWAHRCHKARTEARSGRSQGWQTCIQGRRGQPDVKRSMRARPLACAAAEWRLVGLLE